MKYKLLLLLIEGDDDVRFFEKIIKPKFEEKYNSVKLWKYVQEKRKKLTAFLGASNL